MNKDGKGELPFGKDEVVRVSIQDISSDGAGIGKVDGFTLFIKDAVVGDTVIAKIMKVKKGYGFARLLEVAEPSPFRVAPACPIARKCGGCQIQELSYDEQLVFKAKKVRDVLTRIGGFSTELVNRITNQTLGMEEPWRFRNKEQLPIGMQNGRPVAGFYAGRTHCIVPVEDCLVGSAENRVIMKTVLEYMERCHVPAYDEETGKGLMRHVLIRNGRYTDEIMVCLVVNGTKLPHEERLVRELCDLDLSKDGRQNSEGIEIAGEEHGRRDRTKTAGTGHGRQNSEGIETPGEEHGRAAVQIASISLNTNTARTNVIMGEQTRTLWGSDTITDVMHVMDVEMIADRTSSEGMSDPAGTTDRKAIFTEKQNGALTEPATNGTGKKAKVIFHDAHREVTFRISPLSFYQVNPTQAERLYSLVRYYAGLTGREIVWDLYCGVGTIGCFLAADAKEVYGVEVIPDAIRDARKNAADNNISNITFHVGKAEEVVPAYVEQRLKELKAKAMNTVGEGKEQACGKTLAQEEILSVAAGGDVTAEKRIVDVVVVDPPRKGCDEKCLETILQVAPKRIVYVSCDPATMARDCKILAAGGYELKAVQPVDQFPHTIHVETVVLMSRK